jgi:hypothetical protein
VKRFALLTLILCLGACRSESVSEPEQPPKHQPAVPEKKAAVQLDKEVARLVKCYREHRLALGHPTHALDPALHGRKQVIVEEGVTPAASPSHLSGETTQTQVSRGPDGLNLTVWSRIDGAAVLLEWNDDGLGGSWTEGSSSVGASLEPADLESAARFLEKTRKTVDQRYRPKQVAPDFKGDNAVPVFHNFLRS